MTELRFSKMQRTVSIHVLATVFNVRLVLHSLVGL